MRPRTSPVWAMPSEEFRDLIARSATLTEALKPFGLSMRGANYKTLLRRVAEEGIDISHFQRFVPVPPSPARPLSEILASDSPTSTWHLRNRLIRAQVLPEVCAICSIGNSWQGRPLALHLDHIDGDRTNNRLENLRLLCPNCHSQTGSYAGRKNAGTAKREPNLCSQCGKPRPIRSRLGRICRQCADAAKRKVMRPDERLLREQVEKLGYTKTGALYGVSDNAVRKWLAS